MNLVSFVFADMSRPKRIKNLLKSLLGTHEYEYIKHRSQNCVLQDTITNQELNLHSQDNNLHSQDNNLYK